MRIIVKKLVSFLMIAGMMFFMLDSTVMAEKENKLTDMVVPVDTELPDLQENYDEDSTLCKKLEYDKDNNITKLSDDVEESLNEAGVFDSELIGLDKETKSALENSINTQVYISYASIDDITGQIIELDCDEVDELVEEQIEEGNIEYEEKESVMAYALEKIGILPRKVSAATVYYKDSKSSKSSSGAVKQTIYACQSKKGGTISVTATATWLDEAYYRNIDVFGVSVGNGLIVSNSYSCSHTATYKFWNNYTGKISKYSCSTKPTAYVIGGSGSGIAYRVNLFGSRGKMKAVSYSGAGSEYYENEKITVKFKCKVANKNIKKVSLVPHYQHAKTNSSISPSISVSKGGLSVGISGSKKNYYQEITRNPILQYSYK